VSTLNGSGKIAASPPAPDGETRSPSARPCTTRQLPRELVVYRNSPPTLSACEPASYLLDQQAIASWSRHWLAPTSPLAPANPDEGLLNLAESETCPGTAFSGCGACATISRGQYQAAGSHALKVGASFCTTTSSRAIACGAWATDGERVSRSGAGGDAGDLPGSVQRRHLEPGRALSDHDALQGRRLEQHVQHAVHDPKYGAWAQDDWTIGPRVTLNLGVRWDLAWNAFGRE